MNLFLSGRQQDAKEYLDHLLDRIEKEDRVRGKGIGDHFTFKTEQKMVCTSCNGKGILHDSFCIVEEAAFPC